MFKLKSDEMIIIRRTLIVIGFFVVIMIFQSLPYTHLHSVKVIIDKGIVQHSSCMQKTRVEYYNKNYHMHKYDSCRAEVLWEKSGLKISNYAMPVLDGDCLTKYEIRTYKVNAKDRSLDVTKMIPVNVRVRVEYCK